MSKKPRLPKSVIAAGEAAQAELERVTAAQPTDQDGNADPAPDPNAAAAAAEPTHEPAPEPQTTPTEPQHAAPPTPPAQLPAGDTVPRPEYERLHAAHTTLQGKYTSEIRALRQQLAEAESDLNLAVKELLALQTGRGASASTPGGKPAAPAAATELTDEQLGITADDREAMGPEALAVLRKTLSKLKADIHQSTEQSVRPIAETAEQQVEQRFWTDFQARVPDFQSINAMPEFETHLGTVDPNSGQTLYALLMHARKNRDVTRCAHFYDTFKRQAGLSGSPSADPSAAPPAPTPAAAPAKPAPRSMDSRVTPGAAPAVAPRPAPPPSFKQSDVSKFYRDKALGKFKANDQLRAQAERLDREYTQAAAENRILPG